MISKIMMNHTWSALTSPHLQTCQAAKLPRRKKKEGAGKKTRAAKNKTKLKKGGNRFFRDFVDNQSKCVAATAGGDFAEVEELKTKKTTFVAKEEELLESIS